MKLPQELQRLFFELEQGRWSRLRLQREREIDAAQANPEKYATTRAYAPGASTNYRYYGPRKRAGCQTRYCYAVGKNAAGFYLTWKETVTPKQIARDNFEAWKTRKDAQVMAKHRADQAAK